MSSAPAQLIAAILIACLLCCLGCGTSNAALVMVAGGSVALTHVRVIDGTGAPAKEDQTLVIEHGRIREMGDAAAVNTIGVAQTIELRGRTVIPVMVGIHDHLFYTEFRSRGCRRLICRQRSWTQ
jgi:cytosine/adenosine deaminase-related metal-dependent hydrolase